MNNTEIALNQTRGLFHKTSFQNKTGFQNMTGRAARDPTLHHLRSGLVCEDPSAIPEKNRCVY